MIRNTLMLLSVVAVVLISTSCQELEQTQEASLQLKVDSLAALLKNHEKIAATLHEADILMDSIDANRNILRTQMREGTSFEDFTSRIAEINDYVKRSESKIHDLEIALRSAKQSGSSYITRIQDLKTTLEKNTSDIAMLEEQVTKYKSENGNLVTTVTLQQAEIEDKLNQIVLREEEVVKLEVRINEILAHSKINEAEAYFARAEALELAAVRTNFAPKKKKMARQEALDMYKMAVLYGKCEAQKKVDELAKKL